MLFGARRRRKRYDDKPTVVPYAPGADALMAAHELGHSGKTAPLVTGKNPEGVERMRRRGFLGRVAGNDGDPATPNLWDWLVLGPTAPDILQERAQRRGLFDFRRRALERDEEQVQRVQDWAASADDPLAAIDPEGTIQRMQALRGAEGLAPIERENALYSRGYRIGEGGEYERFGPAADDWALAQQQMQISRANAARGATNRYQTINQPILNSSFEASNDASNLSDLVTRFLALNAEQPTGTGTDLNPGSWIGESRTRRNEMEGLTSRMISLVRSMSGERGVFTDEDARRMERGLPSVHRAGPTNQNMGGALQQAARNAQDQYQFFAEVDANGGSLNDARALWTQYIRSNPIFDAGTGELRFDRPGFTEWLQMGGPDLSRSMRNASGSRSERAPQQRIRVDANGNLITR